MAIMRYAFEELGLHRLDGSWFEDNIPSKSLYMKCGWKEEGMKRSCVYKRGEWRDLVTVGVLDSDYYELIRKNRYWE